MGRSVLALEAGLPSLDLAIFMTNGASSLPQPETCAESTGWNSPRSLPEPLLASRSLRDPTSEVQSILMMVLVTEQPPWKHLYFYQMTCQSLYPQPGEELC